MRVIGFLGFLALAACGADGAPLRPSASLGLGVGSDGVEVGGGFGVTDGTVSLGIGL